MYVHTFAHKRNLLHNFRREKFENCKQRKNYSLSLSPSGDGIAEEEVNEIFPARLAPILPSSSSHKRKKKYTRSLNEK